MSYHPVTQKVEAAARSYMASAVPTATIRGSEHIGIGYETRSVYVICDQGDGIYALTGVADVTVKVEVRTMIMLYSSFTSAIADHKTLCGLVFDALMDDTLATQLTVSGLTIQGVKSQETQSHKVEGTTMVTSFSRVIRAVPQ